jgi:hypothetical protein
MAAGATHTKSQRRVADWQQHPQPARRDVAEVSFFQKAGDVYCGVGYYK